MIDYKNYGKTSNLKELMFLIAVFIMGTVLGLTITDFKGSVTIKVHDKGVQLDCRECHRKVAMTRYFERRGNPTPEAMAEAVLATKSPRLMAAIAVKGEKNTPYWIRNGGYKKRHAGAWQMSKAHKKTYGEVPYDPIGQALQAERYLSDAASEKNIKEALNEFGGDSQGHYANTVLSELVNVPYVMTKVSQK
jgi:hypothetical protein